MHNAFMLLLYFIIGIPLIAVILTMLIEEYLWLYKYIIKKVKKGEWDF